MLPTDGDSQFQADMYQNVLNMGAAYGMYSTTFGNPNFVIQPATPGEVQDGFPAVPYLGIEAVLWTQQMSNPASAPNTILAGGSAGQQVISSSQTASDANGTSRLFTGVQNTA